VKATANEATLTMVNNRVYANAKLTKVDDSTAHRPISGAIFELHKTGYTTGTADRVIKSNLSTNAQGVINTSTLAGTYTDTDDVIRNFGQNSSHNGLTVGSYYFKETTTPASYKDGDNQNIAFTILRGDDGLTKVVGADTVDPETVVLNDLMNTKLKLFKYTEKDTGLKDAEFTLICVPADGQPKETIIGKTGTDGLMVDTATGQVISLKRGTYTLTETKATPGYELKGTDGKAFSCQFTVGNDDADKTLVIVEAGTTGLLPNEKVASYVQGSITNTAALTATGVQNTEIVVTLNKTDGENQPLTGATFTLSGRMAKAGTEETKNNLPLAMTDQSNIVINSKTLGGYSLITGETYTLKETVRPAGYQKHEEVIFKVMADGTGKIELVQTTPPQTGVTVDTDKTTLTVADVQTLATIKLIKAGEDGSPLANVSFSLYKKGNDQAIQNGQTGLDGTLKFENLAEGTYYFKETATPDDYALDTAPTQEITIGEKDHGQTLTVNKTNAKINAKLNLIKKDKEDDSLIQGTTFELIYTPQTTSNTPITYTLTTGADGVAKITAKGDAGCTPEEVVLPGKGSYVLTETGNALSGYQTPTEVECKFTFDVSDAEKGKTLTIAENNLSTNDTVKDFNLRQIGTGTDVYLKAGIDGIFNERNTGSVALKKVDHEKKPLPGATFKLQKKNGNNYEDVKNNTAVTDGKGLINYIDLPFGDYKIVETIAAPGYVLGDPAPSREFIIDRNQVAYEFVSDDTQITNDQTTARINKVSSGTTPLKGATLTVTGKFKSGNSPKTIANNELNTITGDLIVNESYTLTETIRPTGYEGFYGAVLFHLNEAGKIVFEANGNPTLSDGNPAATLSADGNNNLYLRNIAYKGSVTLTKTETAEYGSTGIKAVKFTLYKQIGENPESATDPKIKENLETDSNGIITVNNLEEGNYYFVETAAPDLYKTNTEPQKFIITDTDPTHNHTVAINMTNTRVNADVKVKKHTGTDTALAGATVTLSKNNSIINTQTTGADGYATFTGLSKGTYTITETAAPAGYVLGNTPFCATFAIGDEDTGKNGTEALILNNTFGHSLNVTSGTLTTTGIQNTELNFTINKTDGTNTIQDAAFTLSGNFLNASGEKENKTFTINAGTQKIDSDVLVENGNKFKLAADESYTLTETATPVKYALQTGAITIRFINGGDAVEITSATNAPTA
ncbi:MAG: SpaA isopeptide-forming pilin-related protein, partial [Eubacterium sp.]